MASGHCKIDILKCGKNSGFLNKSELAADGWKRQRNITLAKMYARQRAVCLEAGSTVHRNPGRATQVASAALADR
jgi:hypothetical protein